MLAQEKINGDYIEQFQLCTAYCNQLMKTYPGSTCFVDWEPSEHPLEIPRFRRMYICLDPLKKGFHAGCRKVIGLDGCHTKGLIKQQILTAVAVDPSNGWWPIAWAVVEKENYDIWSWFLQSLKDDIGVRNKAEYCIISDRQKVQF